MLVKPTNLIFLTFSACLRSVFCPMLGVVLASCGHIQHYPLNWPAIEQKTLTECPDISGIYRDDGFCAGKNCQPPSPSPSLGLMFFCPADLPVGRCEPRFRDLTEVEINQPGRSTMDVTVRRGNAFVDRRNFMKDGANPWKWEVALWWGQQMASFSCNKNALVFRQHFFGSAGKLTTIREFAREPLIYSAVP